MYLVNNQREEESGSQFTTKNRIITVSFGEKGWEVSRDARWTNYAFDKHSGHSDQTNARTSDMLGKLCVDTNGDRGGCKLLSHGWFSLTFAWFVLHSIVA